MAASEALGDGYLQLVDDNAERSRVA